MAAAAMSPARRPPSAPSRSGRWSGSVEAMTSGTPAAVTPRTSPSRVSRHCAAASSGRSAGWSCSARTTPDLGVAREHLDDLGDAVDVTPDRVGVVERVHHRRRRWQHLAQPLARGVGQRRERYAEVAGQVAGHRAVPSGARDDGDLGGTGTAYGCRPVERLGDAQQLGEVVDEDSAGLAHEGAEDARVTGEGGGVGGAGRASGLGAAALEDDDAHALVDAAGERRREPRTVAVGLEVERRDPDAVGAGQVVEQV